MILPAQFLPVAEESGLIEAIGECVMRKSFHQARQWQIPLDEIKRDKSFVRHIVKRPGDEALTDALVALAHKMNLVVVAEGVETESQLDLLRRQCCD